MNFSFERFYPARYSQKMKIGMLNLKQRIAVKMSDINKVSSNAITDNEVFQRERTNDEADLDLEDYQNQSKRKGKGKGKSSSRKSTSSKLF